MPRTCPDVPMPALVAALPRDHRGFPVFHVVHRLDDGRIDWKTLDGRIIARCVRDKTCMICGVALGLRVAFVGGPLSVESMVFQEPPMHPTCAEYAATVCPFLASAGWDRSHYRNRDEMTERDPTGVMAEPWGGVAVVVANATSYTPFFGPTNTPGQEPLLFRVLAAHRVTWMKEPATT